MEINESGIYGFINISEKGNVNKILKNFRIKSKKKNIKIIIEPKEVDKSSLKDYLDKGYVILLFTNNLNFIKELCNTIFIIKENKLFLTKTNKQLFKKDYCVITLTSKDVKKIPLPLKNMVIKSITDKKVKFLYNDDINKIINIIKDYKIDKVLIEDIKTEDIFNCCKE